MTLKVNQGRQQLVVAHAEINFSDLTSGVEANALFIPAGAILDSVQVMNEVVFNSGTSDVLDVGWLGGAANGLIDDHNLATAAPARTSAAEDVLGDAIGGSDYITVTWTAVGTAATAGKCYLIVKYFEVGREQFNQDN